MKNRPVYKLGRCKKVTTAIIQIFSEQNLIQVALDDADSRLTESAVYSDSPEI
jgi:hypothetical protein